MFELEGYAIESRLGAGSQGETFGGVEIATGRRVAIKRLRMADVPDWKAVELFEREGRALAGLKHAGIANQIEAFARPAPGGGEDFFLIQERIDGESLDRVIARGETWSPAALAVFLEALATTLAWLHQRNPPIVHRDLKPSNIMRRSGSGNHDGNYVLIDFGALQVMTPRVREDGGSTIVGTSGYMPPEQLLGRTGPASDIYALGATAVHLLTGVHPTRLPLKRLRIDWRSALPRGVEVPKTLGDVLDRMLAPAIEDRFATANEVLQALRKPAPAPVAARPAPAKAAPTPATATEGVPNPAGRIIGMAVIGFIVAVFALVAVFWAVEPAPDLATSAPRHADLVPELRDTPTLPIRIAVEPRLARVLGAEKTSEVLSHLQATPRAWDGDRAGDYVVESLLVQWSGKLALANVKVRWRLVDAAGKVLATGEGDVVASYEAPLHPGDIKGIAARFHAPKREGAAAILMELTSLEMLPLQTPVGTPLEVAWDAPPPDGVKLVFTLASIEDRVDGLGDRRRHVPRIIVENTGTAAIVVLRARKQLDAPDDSVAPVDHNTWVIPHGEPSLLPGERRVFSAWTWQDAALSSWRLAVVEARTGLLEQPN